MQNTLRKKAFIAGAVLLSMMLVPRPVYAEGLYLANTSESEKTVLTDGSISIPIDADADARLNSGAADEAISLSVFYRFPLDTSGYFGMSQKYSRVHRGVDLRGKLGTEIYPILDGVVVRVAYESSGYGRYVVVQHDVNFYSLYAHMAKTEVKAGDRVAQKDVLGTVGITGKTTGPHLHLELFAKNRSYDPMRLLPQVNPASQDQLTNL